MKITYRTKQLNKIKGQLNLCGIGIQVDYNTITEQEALNNLVKELEAINVPKARIKELPPMHDGSNTISFHRQGSLAFGLMTQEEGMKFVADTISLLKKYDKKFKPNLYQYDND